MYVTVDQLVPGTVLTEDVLGQSGKPILPKQTILTEKKIHFLKKFLIQKVAIKPRLSDGTLFVPN